MKIQLQKLALLKALSLNQTATERKSTMPVLAYALLETEKQQLKITTTDLEVGIITSVECETEQEGSLCINAKTLYDIVREIDSNLLSLQVIQEGRIELKAGKSNFKIATLPSEGFPNLPTLESTTPFSIEKKKLKQLIDYTLFAASTDESRYHLHGAYLEALSENKLRMVATDGHRLSMVDRDIESRVPFPKGVILPKKGLNELRKLVGDDLENSQGETSILLSTDNKNLLARNGNITLMVRLVDGDFPDYRQVIPKSQEYQLSAVKKELIGALRRVALLVHERSGGLRLKLNENLIQISTSNPELGEASEELPVRYSGPTLNLGFNARYFLDVLAVIEDEEIFLELSNETGPCVIRSQKDADFLSILMPMRI